MENFELLYKEFAELRKDVKDILQRVSRLEVKAALWGGGGAAVILAIKELIIK